MNCVFLRNLFFCGGSVVDLPGLYSASKKVFTCVPRGGLQPCYVGDVFVQVFTSAFFHRGDMISDLSTTWGYCV